MNIRFTQNALADLDVIFEYISSDDADAAKRVIARILQAVAMIEGFPLLGRVGRIAETRELPIVRLPYYAVYRLVDDTEIDIIAVMHERQKFPA